MMLCGFIGITIYSEFWVGVVIAQKLGKDTESDKYMREEGLYHRIV